jgi:hypothetical protein
VQVVQNIYKDLGPKGFQPIGVTVDANPAVVTPDFVRRYGLTWPCGWSALPDILGIVKIEASRFRVPSMVLLDRAGRVQRRFPGGDPLYNNEEVNLRKEIEAMLKPGAR